ncbi:hypothetical protein LCGC14_1514490 [marine sediment metagenome]|uniref:Cadherin domain-containing protein n=2 Tax=root TaxID=1 RepID=A0A831QLQ6_9FLAO|nr:hypothetical protein [Pricia antarctica]
MRRIVLPILSLLAVACSSEIDEVTFEEVNEEFTVVGTPNHSAKKESPENPTKTATNHAPVFEQQLFGITEHSKAGSSIGFLNANDIDEDTVTYHLESNIDIDIDENTGELRVGANLKLDYETTPTIQFLVSAFDGKFITEKVVSLNIQDVDEVALLSKEQKELISYFQYITFWKGPSHTPNSINQKWESDMKIHLSGNITSAYKDNAEGIISQYNTLFADGDFRIQLTENQDEANTQIFFGTQQEVEGVWPDMYNIIRNGNYSGYAMTPSHNAVLLSSRIWISNPIEVLLKHELGHALGFGHSNKCEDEHSFLCSRISGQNDILPIEADIIRYLYHRDVPAGLSETEIEAVLANIIINEH